MSLHTGQWCLTTDIDTILQPVYVGAADIKLCLTPNLK